MATFRLSKQEVVGAGIDPDFICSVLPYAAPKCKRAQWDAHRHTLTVEFEGTRFDLDRLLATIGQKIGRNLVNREAEVRFDRVSTNNRAPTDIWRELLDLNLVRPIGNGLCAYRGFFLELVRQLDAHLLEAAVRLRADAIHLPSLGPVEHAERGGVFVQYPHYLFFAATLEPDMERIEEFQSDDLAGTGWRRYFGSSDHCLKTSACLPLYPTLQDRDFEQEARFTMLGTCSRNESINATTCERLCEFQMREIVFVGDAAGSREFETLSMNLFRTLIECFDLTGEIAQANDSFFIANSGALRLSQWLGKDKYEARVLVPQTNARIAVASFNHHRSFFGRRFNFTYRNEAAASACVGFGLERLAYGIVSQHGVDRPRIRSMLDDLRQSLGRHAR